MARKKETAVEQTVNVAELAAQLHGVTKNWRPTHVISGNALQFIQEKVAAINEALNPSEEEVETVSDPV